MARKPGQSFADFYGFDEETEPDLAPTEESVAGTPVPTELPEETPPEPQGDREPGQSFSDYYGFDDPEPEPAPKEDPGLWDKISDFTRTSIVDQLVGGGYEFLAREDTKDAVDYAKQVRDIDEGAPLSMAEFATRGAGAPPASVAKSFTRYTSKSERADAVKSLQKNLDSAAKFRAKGEEIPFSQETKDFLDEESGKSIWEAFSDAPATVIVELGSRSGTAMLPGLAAGAALGAVGSTLGPKGGVAGFAVGMGAGSGRVEYAASLVEALNANGVDTTDAESIVGAVGDEDLMAKVQKFATARAAIIGGVDGLAGLIGAKHFTPGLRNAITRELANAGLQMPVQGGLGGVGEAAAQMATTGEINPREVAAEIAGEFVTAPIDVATAAVSGAREQGGLLTADLSPLEALDAVSEQARKDIAAVGGDALTQELGAAEAVSGVAPAINESLAAGRRYQEETTAATERAQTFDKAEAERQGVRDGEDAVLGEISGQQRARQAERAEEQRLRRIDESKTAEFAEKEFQDEMAIAAERQELSEAEVAAEVGQPETPTLGETQPALAKLKQQMAEPEPVVEAEPVPQLEDQRPITVTPEGEAVTPSQRDASAGEVEGSKTPELLALEAATRESRAGIQADRDAIDAAAQEAATSPLNDLPEPTAAQKSAGNYKKGAVNVQGMDLMIENPKGSVRRGANFEQEMQDHYGYIRRSEGADGDQVDIFVGDQPESESVFVVDQINQESGRFDEHKAMVGYPNQLAAVRAYKRNYQKGWKVGPITEMPVSEFKNWVKNGNTTAPLKRITAPEPAPVSATEEQVAEAQAVEERRAPRRRIRFRRGEQAQEITSADTSVDQTPAIVKQGDKRGFWRKGQKNIDIGGGRFAKGTEALAERGVESRVIDPFNRSETENAESLAWAQENNPDTATVSNVLNVIKEPRARAEVIKQAAELAPTAYFTVDQGDRKGTGRATPNGWQENRPVNTYVSEIQRYFENVERRGSVIIASNPSKGARFRAGKTPGVGMTVKEAQSAISELQKQLPQLDVEVVSTVNDLPQEVQDRIPDAINNSSLKGAYDPRDGKIYMLAENFESAESAQKTLLHEGVAHHGLRVMLGEDLDPMLATIFENSNNENLSYIAGAYGLDMDNANDQIVIAEEYVAKIAEDGTDAGVLQKIVDAVREVLRKIGVVDNWTYNDIKALLRDTRKALKGKPLSEVTVTTDVEIEETGEIIQLEEQADVAIRQLQKRIGVVEQLKGCLSA